MTLRALVALEVSANANGGCANNLKIERGHASELLLPEAEVEDEEPEATVPPLRLPLFRYHQDVQEEEESDNESEFESSEMTYRLLA